MKYLIILFLIIIQLHASTNRKVTLQLSWLHQFQFAGYYVAKEHGFYKDVGIDIEIKEFDYGMNLLNTINDKKADFAIGRSSLLIDKSNGHDIVALGAIFQNSPLMLLVKDGSGINTLQDLINKKVMITSDAKDSAALVAMLGSRNIRLDDLTVQKHSFNIDDLINNKTDAMASYISNEPIRLDQKGIAYKVFHPKDYGFDFYSDILFTSSKFIKTNPKLTKEFFEATEKGWDYAFSHIEETAQIIRAKYNTQNRSLSHLIAEGKLLKKSAYDDSENCRIGCLDKDKLQKIIDVYKVLGLMNNDINLNEFVYENNPYQTVKFNLTHNDVYLLFIIGVLLLMGFISLVFYFSIKRKWLMTKKILESEISSKTSKLEKQTYIDFLTNAKNRKAYKEKMEELLSLFKRYQTPFSIAIFDIDDFKYINDNYGHRVGDNVLIDIVKLVQSDIRENDFLYRIGGEEFTILFPQTSLENAKIVVLKIRESIEKNLNTVADKTITASFGLVEVMPDENEDHLYKRVDKLLYESKENGKNRVSYQT